MLVRNKTLQKIALRDGEGCGSAADLHGVCYPFPSEWKRDGIASECSFHQLSPYIGKLQSDIARALVKRYSKPGDLVVDPFSGSGTVPLEALLCGRNAFASDISQYAKVLTVGKASAPSCLFTALARAEDALAEAVSMNEPDLRSVPAWVRRFFHPRTLKEAIQFSSVCNVPGREFLLGCFLGVLHHQRPGFLSFPSSHLVPYLRNKKFPRDIYPELYAYRDLRSRLIAKIERSYRRVPSKLATSLVGFQGKSIDAVRFPKSFDALITSPPYMNALDYGRDNRLRLWFIDKSIDWQKQERPTSRKETFLRAMHVLASLVQDGLRRGGHCILVVGEESQRKGTQHPSKEVANIMLETATKLRLIDVLYDHIPDIRRSRRECRGVKAEHILVFKKR